MSRKKSRIAPRSIWVTDERGKLVSTTINERQIVICSAKYARKARQERLKVVNKTNKRIWSLSKDAKASSFG